MQCQSNRLATVDQYNIGLSSVIAVLLVGKYLHTSAVCMIWHWCYVASYKHADGKKIDGRRVLVDVERGRTVKGWQPRRLGRSLVYWHFYGTKRSGARYCHDKLSICLSIHLSVTLVDCDHTHWNSSKIISRMISFGTWLLADPNITGLLQREHPQILAGIGVG